MKLRVANVTANSQTFPDCAFLIGEDTDDLELRIRTRYRVESWHDSYFETPDDIYDITICDLHVDDLDYPDRTHPSTPTHTHTHEVHP